MFSSNIYPGSFLRYKGFTFINDLEFDLHMSSISNLTVQLDSVYDFIFMGSSNILSVPQYYFLRYKYLKYQWPSIWPFKVIQGKTIIMTGQSTLVILLIFNSNICRYCRSSFPRHRDMECMWPWFYLNEFDFTVTFQIWLCIWTPQLPISVQQQYVLCGNCCLQVIMAWKMRSLWEYIFAEKNIC